MNIVIALLVVICIIYIYYRYKYAEPTDDTDLTDETAPPAEVPPTDAVNNGSPGTAPAGSAPTLTGASMSPAAPATPAVSVEPTPLTNVSTATGTPTPPPAPAPEPAPTGIISTISTAVGIAPAAEPPAPPPITVTPPALANTATTTKSDDPVVVEQTAPTPAPPASSTIGSVLSVISDSTTGSPTMPTLYTLPQFKGESWTVTGEGTFDIKLKTVGSVKIPSDWKISAWSATNKSLWTKTKNDNRIDGVGRNVTRISVVKPSKEQKRKNAPAKKHVKKQAKAPTSPVVATVPTTTPPVVAAPPAPVVVTPVASSTPVVATTPVVVVAAPAPQPIVQVDANTTVVPATQVPAGEPAAVAIVTTPAPGSETDAAPSIFDTVISAATDLVSPPQAPILYSKPNFKGTTWSPQGTGKFVIPPTMSGKVQSIKVPGGWAVSAYNSVGCGGTPLWTKTNANENKFSAAQQKISCILVTAPASKQKEAKKKQAKSKAAAPSAPAVVVAPVATPVIYMKGKYGGQTFVIPAAGQHVLTGKLDNSAASVKVPAGWSLDLYDKPDCTGKPLNVTADMDGFPKGYKNTVSCVRAYAPAATPAAPLTSTPAVSSPVVYATMYGRPKFAGGSFDVTALGNTSLKGTKMNSNAASIRIPAGTQLVAYSTADCTGKGTTYTADVADLADTNMKNAIKCVSVSRK